MEFTEPKRGDLIFHSGRITEIDGFSEDDGTILRNGQSVCISNFEKNSDGVWVPKSPPRTYLIGEHYENYRSSRKGVAVIRPAVFLCGKMVKVITHAHPCSYIDRHLVL